MNKKVIMVSSVAALLLSSTALFAHEKAVEGDIALEGTAVDGLVGAGGNAVVTGLGECLQLGGYSEDNTNAGCEGSDGEPEPEPEPEPEVAATPEPEPAPPEEIVKIATLGGQALFDTDSDTLNGEGEQALADLLVDLEQYQEISVMYVTGHTDSRGSEEYNQGLSERRATAVAKYLVSQGVDGGMIDVSGMGESSPVASNDSEAGRSKNRRVEVHVGTSRLMN